MEWAHELAVDKRLRGATRDVLLALAYHANSRSGRSWPATETLAGELGVDERTVRRSFAALERRPDPDTGEVAGYLEATRRAGYTVVWHFPVRGDTGVRKGGHPGPKGGTPVSGDPGVSRREPGAGRDPRGIFLSGTGWIRD